ncbi:Glycosyltransferase involved in cell wall biogenesis [Planctomycetales bacterium 10988]|nr:Glycosyltransferase involved in cell wall biogenesis [Planctomycetales bacterium 10988]
MPDFFQNGLITTLHDLGTIQGDRLEDLLLEATQTRKVGLVLPVTASDMQAAPFREIVKALKGNEFIDTICVVLGVAPDAEQYRETKEIVAELGDRAQVLWTDGPRIQAMYEQLNEAGFRLSVPGKGRSVWTAFGYLLADQNLHCFALHDCDIVNYRREMLARLCLPMAHAGFDFEFCKAYYARRTDRLHGRVVRLLVSPLLRALIAVLGHDSFLDYLDSFRYPLSGEFAVTANLARSNRIPSDWGLEVGTLAEVFRNTSLKRVCQVDLCESYEHKHQELSLEDSTRGLMKMANDILTTIFRTLASRGKVLSEAHFLSLRSAYLRTAQDAIRQYHADAVMNGLTFSRHSEEQAVEGFAAQVMTAGETFRKDPAGGEAISNWTRVITAFPHFPHQLRQAAREDANEFA